MLPPLVRIHARVALVRHDDVYTTPDDRKTLLEHCKLFFPRQIIGASLESPLRTRALSVSAAKIAWIDLNTYELLLDRSHLLFASSFIH